METAVVTAVLDDWRTAPVDERLRAMLAYIEKLTLAPDSLSKDDIQTLNASGVSDEAIFEASYVCFLFNIIDRLADSFDFELPTDKFAARDGSYLHIFGYRPTW